MKGLELSRSFYLEYGEPMLKKEFPELLPLMATGLVGSGSECFGYDDELSRDHDFEPGFCIFLPSEEVVDRKSAFLLERAYSKLPKEFCGYERSTVSPVGGNRHGVIRAEEFFLSKTGDPKGELSLREWFEVPEQSLLEATNGEIFFDGSGELTQTRKRLERFPEDVRLKKLAAALLLMGQAGQYNYPRCLKRGERGAGMLALYEFVKNAMHAVFLINGSYTPYYKWRFKALSRLPVLCELSNSFEYLLGTEDDGEKKLRAVEEVCKAIGKALTDSETSLYTGNEAEGHAYSVNGKISDSTLRNLHVLFAAE